MVKFSIRPKLGESIDGMLRRLRNQMEKTGVCRALKRAEHFVPRALDAERNLFAQGCAGMPSMLDFEQVNAELSRRSLLAFAKRLEPGFEEPPHIKLLVDLLGQLERGEIRRLCVSMPPRFGKTTLCSQLAPSFFIGRDPKRTVIRGNHSSESASSFSRKAKGYIENPNWPFSSISLSQGSRAIHRWNVTPGGGGLFSVGVGSGITGIGADFLIVDDPINDAL